MNRLFVAATALALAIPTSRVHADQVRRDDGFRLTLDVFGEWTDNRDSVSGERPPEGERKRFEYEKTDAFTLGVNPRLSFRRDLQLGQFRVEYGPTYRWWENPRVGQRRTELTHELYTELKYRTGGRTDLLLYNNFKYIDDADLYMGSDEAPVDPEARRLTEENSHYDNRLTGQLSYRLTERLSAEAGAYWRIRRYDETFLADNGDEDEFGLTLAGWRQHSAQLSYGLNLRYAWFDRESPDDLELGMETLTLGANVRYRVNKYVDASAWYGYEFVWHESDEIDDREYPADMRIELGITPDVRARMVAGLSMRVTESYVHPYVSQELLALYSSLSYQHTSRLSSTVRVEYRTTDYEERYTDPRTPDGAFGGSAASRPRGERDGERNELFFRVGVNYRLLSQLMLSAYYSHTDVDSDVNTSYSRNVIGARARYEF